MSRWNFRSNYILSCLCVLRCQIHPARRLPKSGDTVTTGHSMGHTTAATRALSRGSPRPWSAPRPGYGSRMGCCSYPSSGCKQAQVWRQAGFTAPWCWRATNIGRYWSLLVEILGDGGQRDLWDLGILALQRPRRPPLLWASVSLWLNFRARTRDSVSQSLPSLRCPGLLPSPPVPFPPFLDMPPPARCPDTPSLSAQIPITLSQCLSQLDAINHYKKIRRILCEIYISISKI